MWDDESSRTEMAEDLTDQEFGVPQRKEEESTKLRSGTGRDDSCGSRTWLGRNDPRIVRASSSFGGKDRHSKVRTIKGLKDRRVRLSVQTAIQLYDLQDRLGFNQPSKVVDWLINATQHEIDKLPPLQMPESMEEDDCGSGGGIRPFPSPIQNKLQVKSEQPNFFNLTMKDNNGDLGQRFEDVEGQKNMLSTNSSYFFSNNGTSNGYLPAYLPPSSLSLMPATSQVTWTSMGTSSSFQQNGYDSKQTDKFQVAPSSSQNMFFGRPTHFYTPFHPTDMSVASPPPSRPSK